MARYAITERAGPFVAAHRNTGVGTVLELSERQAEHELRLGTLVALPLASGDIVSVSAPDIPEADIPPAVPNSEPKPLLARKPRRSGT